MDVQLIGSGDVNDDSTNGTFFGNDPQPFVLRDDPQCESLLGSLDTLGVTEFRCLLQLKAGDGASVFATTPAFRKGTRLSSSRLQAAKQVAWALGNVIGDAVEESLAGTSAAGYDLLVEALVIVSDLHGPRGISTWVTAINAVESEFDSRAVPLL